MIPLELFEPPIEHPTIADFYDSIRRQRIIEQQKVESRARDMVQVRALLAASWKYELPQGDYQEGRLARQKVPEHDSGV